MTRFKDFPPAWLGHFGDYPNTGHIKIPAAPRGAARGALALYAPATSRGILLQRVLWVTMGLLGSAGLPGRTHEWDPGGVIDKWDLLLSAWRERLGDFDGLGVYRHRRHPDSRMGILLLRGSEPISFVKLRCDEEGRANIEREGEALHAVSVYEPRTFRFPIVQASDCIGDWHYVAVSPVLSGPHEPASIDIAALTMEVSEALQNLPRPATVDPAWSPMHGDLTPWNLRRARGSSSAVLIDWEESGWGPPGADRFLYRVITGKLEGRPIEPSAADPGLVRFWEERGRARWFQPA